MPELKLTLQVEQDGVELPGFPLIFRQILTEALPLEIQIPPNGNTSSYIQIPGTIMGTLQALVVSTDQQLNVQVNNGGPIPLNPGGLLVIFGANIAAVNPATNATVNNPAGLGSPNANLVGAAAGT